MHFFSFILPLFSSIFSKTKYFLKSGAAICLGIFSSACHPVCVMPNDFYADLNRLYPSKSNIAQINQSVGEKEGIPKPVKKIRLIGPVQFERLQEANIHLPPEPKANTRYVTLVFTDKSKAEGILNEQRLDQPGTAILTRWIPADHIAQALKERDAHQFSAKYGLKWAKPNFDNLKIQTCVGRITAQGFHESFPFEAWSYCANPKTKKSLNKFQNSFFLDMKRIFFDPIYILLDAS